MHWRWTISIQTHSETERAYGCGRLRAFVIILNVWMSNSGARWTERVGRVPTMTRDKSWASLSMWAASSHIRLLSLFVFMHSRKQWRAWRAEWRPDCHILERSLGSRERELHTGRPSATSSCVVTRGRLLPLRQFTIPMWNTYSYITKR